MNQPVRRLAKPCQLGTDQLLAKEWLVTNGLGGYASGTVGGVPTRRFHGLLIAALPAPRGRMLIFNELAESLLLPDGRTIPLGGQESRPGSVVIECADYLHEFRLEMGLPVWTYRFGEWTLEKRLFMPHQQNTVCMIWRLLEGTAPVSLELKPALHPRPHDGALAESAHGPYRIVVTGDRYEIDAPELPPLRFLIRGEQCKLVLDQGSTREFHYRIEARRGYDSQEILWSPGYFVTRLSREHPTSLQAGIESWTDMLVLPVDEALSVETDRRRRLLSAAMPVAKGMGAELVLAADQFLVLPMSRYEDMARLRAAGDEARTVIAGYPWFTDWGRDTMISLEGLALITGRFHEARGILRTFANHVRDGLIPNLFPEGQSEGLYHTADATLWFFHALDRYLQITEDHETLHLILPKLLDIAEHHVHGTRFGIGVDPADGLLHQGAPHYQLTWMDAKIGDWVITPRRGKAVEINALWYNALRLLEKWTARENPEAAGKFGERAEQAFASFNRRFWYGEGGYLHDVVDGESGDDHALRPNQLLAISLPHPVLDESRWAGVLDVVSRRLLTPYGLRTLSADHPDYRAAYDGDLRARDAAYHQGTVWPWLIGPFVDAWLKVHPEDPAAARQFLQGFDAHLGEAGIGSVSEIFDAEAPFHPRGCVAQAWSVAEVLRAWCLSDPDSSRWTHEERRMAVKDRREDKTISTPEPE